mgnify:FL=1
MLKKDFFFDLPEELIAKYPSLERTHSRLLCLDGKSGALSEGHFYDVLELVKPGDLLVFNNTRVIPARLFGHKETGGHFELLIERVLGEHNALVHLKSSKSPKEGARLIFDKGYEAVMERREGQLFELCFQGEKSIFDILSEIGHIPLPPYIDRSDELSDKERYQTVYSLIPGAVAAPTAGLHFDNDLIEKLKAKGVTTAFVTLHVGAGTFQPVREDDVVNHHMHSEYAVVPNEVVEAVLKTKAAGGRVIAVGTTSVRSLESAAQAALKKGCADVIAPFAEDTSIFIYPGYKYRVIDALITNFHLPESTLIMLVSAFAGYKHVMAAYKYAVENKFRFFSYGDAMFITKNDQAESEAEVDAICAAKAE